VLVGVVLLRDRCSHVTSGDHLQAGDYGLVLLVLVLVLLPDWCNLVTSSLHLQADDGGLVLNDELPNGIHALLNGHTLLEPAQHRGFELVAVSRSAGRLLTVLAMECLLCLL
jgi:hypothetical protein